MFVLNNLLNLTKNFAVINKPALFYAQPLRGYCIALNKQNESQSDKENTREQQNIDQQKTLSVAVIGVPNAGKSTFINNLINHRVSTKTLWKAFTNINK